MYEMNTGGFYGHYGQPLVSTTPPLASSQHSRIPDFVSPSVPRQNPGSTMELSQKVDQILYMMEQQRKETAELKVEVAGIKKEVDNFKTEISSIASSSTVSSPSWCAPKIPTKLSVSYDGVWHPFIKALQV